MASTLARQYAQRLPRVHRTLDYRLSERHTFTGRYYQNDTANNRTINPNDINTVANSEST
jgi:hypothetical protein